MIIRVANIFFVLAVLSAMSCASTGSASKAGGGRDYHEDLSAYRPDFTEAMDTIESPENVSVEEVTANITPEHDITSEVNMLMDNIIDLKKDIKYIDGFTVQVYTGTSKEQANAARAEVYNILPDSKPEQVYNSPNFKVKVGKFYTRREALKTLAELKSKFPAPIIIPERFSIAN